MRDFSGKDISRDRCPRTDDVLLKNSKSSSPESPRDQAVLALRLGLESLVPASESAPLSVLSLLLVLLVLPNDLYHIRRKIIDADVPDSPPVRRTDLRGGGGEMREHRSSFRAEPLNPFPSATKDWRDITCLQSALNCLLLGTTQHLNCTQKQADTRTPRTRPRKRGLQKAEVWPRDASHLPKRSGRQSQPLVRWHCSKSV